MGSKRRAYKPRDSGHYHSKKHAARWLREVARRIDSSPSTARYKVVLKASIWNTDPAAEVVVVGYEFEPKPEDSP